jgi:hypothetical protein
MAARRAGGGTLAALAASGPARQAAVLIAYLAAGVALTWPLAARLPARLPAVRDVASYVWALWWVPHQLVHFASPWFTAHLAAPAGIPLGFDTLMPLAGLIMAPLTLTAGPAVSYTVLSIALPGLLCYAMYRAARYWLRNEAGALAAGAFFGLSAMLAWQDWYHLNLAAGELFLPLALLAALRLSRVPRPRRAVALGLVTGAAALVNQESAVLAGLLAALTLCGWLARRPLRLAKLRLTVLAAVTAVITAGPQLAAMAQAAAAGGAAAPAGALARSYRAFAVGLPALLSPSPVLGRYGLGVLAAGYRYRDYEGIATFGVVLAVLALAGLAVSWRRRGARLLGLLWLATGLLALGPALIIGTRAYLPLAVSEGGVRLSGLAPYTWLVRVPGLGAFREADRFLLLGLVPAALLAGAAVAWLATRARPRVAVAVLATVAVLAGAEAGWPGGGHFWAAMPAAMPALDRPIAADRSGSVVVDVPYGLWGGMPARYGSAIAPPALLLATADGHPRAESYTSWIPVPLVARMRQHPFCARLIAAQHGHPSSQAELAAARADAARLGIGWAVLWQDSAGVARYLQGAGFRPSYQVSGIWVYRFMPPGPLPAR